MSGKISEINFFVQLLPGTSTTFLYREEVVEKEKVEKFSKSENFQDRFLVVTGRQLSGRPGLSSGESPAKIRKSTFSYSYCPEHPLLSYIGKRLSKKRKLKNFLSPKN
jgi:hypothetical protein